MDDGEVELSDHVTLPRPDSSTEFQNSPSVDSFLDEFLRNTTTCTHTHTCNPPGPDAAHTHTCYHTHTQVISAEDNHTKNKGNSGLKPRRSSGNREAVRKYREKKKAHTAYLEEEVKKLSLLNQQLARKLQGKAILEAEVLRLRGLLVDLRGKIDNELGGFPFRKQCNTAILFKEGDHSKQFNGGEISLQCQTSLSCSQSNPESSLQANIDGSGKMMVSWEGNCHPAVVDCPGNTEGQMLDRVDTLVSSASQVE